MAMDGSEEEASKSSDTNKLNVPKAKGPRDRTKLTAKQAMIEKFHKQLGTHLQQERGKFKVPIEY